MSSNNLKTRESSFLIYSLGCKVNHYDSAALRSRLLASGFVEPVSGQKKKKNDTLDLLIVNTCTVTKKAITKDKQLIRELARFFPAAKIVVMGCWPETDETVEGFFIRDEALNKREFIFWGVGKLDLLVEKLEKMFFKGFKNRIVNKSNINLASTDKSRYFLKVGDGCNQFCTYCIIPFARGRLKSRSSNDLVLEIEKAIDLGFKEFVLSGIHLGLYGEDKKGKELDLTGLLKKFLKIKGLARLRLSSIEINEVSSELIELMAREERICPHLHISLQSGSDEILRAMGRPYDSNFFLQRVKELREKIPDIAITTDIIVGFPGETQENFLASYDFSKKINFSKIHVFPFSAHEKTAAYKMKNKVSPSEIKDRAKELRELSLKLELNFRNKILEKYQNKDLEVVLENNRNKNRLRGKTKFSFDLEFSRDDVQGLEGENIFPGDLIRLRNYKN